MSTSSPQDPSSKRPPPSTDSPISEPISSSSLSSDTDDASQRRQRRPKHDFPESQASKMWRALSNPSGGPVNEMPGGTYNTAGGKPREPTWRDAFRFELFKKQPGRPSWYQTSCARDSLLVGIGAGGAVGGVSFILRGVSGLLKSSQWAVGAFATTAIGLHVWCDNRRKEEAKGIAAAVTGMKMLHEKRAREEADQKRLLAEQSRRKLEEEEERQRNKRWYKWW